MIKITETIERLKRETAAHPKELKTEVVTEKYRLSRLGAALCVSETLIGQSRNSKNEVAATAAVVGFDESLLEIFWELNRNCPEKAFNLSMKALETEQQLLFLEIENTTRGVYLKGKSLLEADSLFKFDRLAIQLPDAPILCLAGTVLVGMILPKDSIGNFVESREALNYGKWETLETEKAAPAPGKLRKQR